MGVYVKNMSMPKTCVECDIGVCICNRYYDAKFTNGCIKRHSDCPLVEVKDSDVVSVVRCKDCRYWERDSHSGICDRYCVRSDKDWFCAGGEKKEV